MTEELKQKAKEYLIEHSEYSEIFDQTFVCVDTLTAMVEFATEVTKELQEQNTNLQIMLQAEREVRCNEEYLRKVTELEAQIEKMKCCENCIYRGECELGGYKECKNFDKWELAE